MRHTDGATEGISFNHNGDYSGEVLIEISGDATWPFKREPAVEHYPPDHLGDGSPEHWTVRIPFADLKALVARHVRAHRIRELEDATTDTILGV